ncbi:MAG: GNAT family N-acetyltransferase [Clostridia bacterium]|nr:GNAT family N-acetyltransferase [Clostridia bacterium]
MILETKRLLLRPWCESDADDLYEFAKSPNIGPMAGWEPHSSIEQSREIINKVLSAPNTFAVCLKTDNRAIGCATLMVGEKSNIGLPEDEGEIGYWIGEPFWGQGIIPEAVREVLKYGFRELNLQKIWCGYFDGNIKSKRVQEKCGFIYRYTKENVPCAIKGLLRTEHISSITKEEADLFEIQ